MIQAFSRGQLNGKELELYRVAWITDEVIPGVEFKNRGEIFNFLGGIQGVVPLARQLRLDELTLNFVG